jgi:multidrug resistance efflux pump
MLLAEGATPRLTFEKAQKEYQIAKTDADNLEAVAKHAEERVDSMQKEIDAVKKTLDERNAALDEANAELAAGEVRSPVDGVVTGRRGTVGDDVDRTWKDMFQIATDLGALAVVIEPATAALARIKPGQPVSVYVADLPNEALPGQVKKIENGQVTVEFTSPTTVIKPGATAQVKIKLT